LDEARRSFVSELLSGESLSGSPSGNEWVPHLPTGWQLKRLKHLAQVRSGIAKGKDTDGKETVELPYLRVANVQDGHLDLDEVSIIEVDANVVERFSLQSGDVLMNEGGDYDKLGRGALWSGEVSPCLHQNHVFAVRPIEEDLSEWLAAVTQTRYAKFYFMNNAKQSTNLASISQGNVKELPVLLPPKNVRAELLARAREEAHALAKLIAPAQTRFVCSKSFALPPLPMR
jgi:type I restriction enzyme S subunit